MMGADTRLATRAKPSLAAAVTSAEFRHALGQYATGVTVITTLDGEGAPFGVTATSFGSLSLDPPLIQWSLKSAAWSHRIFAASSVFVVNILAADQAAVSTRFATPGIDRFAATDWTPGLDHLPLIEGVAARLECRTEVQVPGGDHTLFIGRVRRVQVFERPPLLHLRGAYGDFVAHAAK